MAGLPTEHRCYGDLAVWWSLISPPDHHQGDMPFLRTLGITRWLLLDRALTEIDPP